MFSHNLDSFVGDTSIMSYRILMIAPTPFFADRGCHIRIYEEIKALQQVGHKVTVCTYHLGRDIEGIDIRRTLRVPWYTKLEAGPSWHKFYLDELLYRKAKKILSNESFDLIHAHLHEGAFIAGRLKKKFNLPVVADFQGSMTDEIRTHGFAGNFPWILKSFRWLEKKINKMPDVLMMSSQKAAEVFQHEFSIHPDKMEVVTDGVDTEAFVMNPTERKEMREKLGISNNQFVVVFLGLLTPYQGIDSLIEMIPEVIRKIQNVHFLIMGFPNENHYRQMCKEKKIESHITFTGKVPYDMARKYLSCGDVAVSSKISKSEGNGKLMNYMAMGLPTVVFDTPVNREILGENGIYAKYPDTHSFQTKLIEILEDSGKRSHLQPLLRTRATNQFSWSQRATQITKLYQALKSPTQNISFVILNFVGSMLNELPQPEFFTSLIA